MILRGVPVNPREFNIETLFFVEVNISPNPLIVPSLSEIRDLSIITPLFGSLMDTLLKSLPVSYLLRPGKRNNLYVHCWIEWK